MDDFPLANYPLTGSHEPAGEVVSLGSEAEKDGRVAVGDRVAGTFHRNPCCEFSFPSSVPSMTPSPRVGEKEEGEGVADW